ncbi:hypothetical protein G6F31_020201 [Rhizopus arrhizus]|nr:hypothetical protein G6F31_020201 [Rhizopus arrhizus]
MDSLPQSSTSSTTGYSVPSSTAPAATPDRRRAPGVQRQRTAHDHGHEGQDIQTAARIHREGVDGGQHAGTDQERSQDAERKSADRQQHGPAAEGPPALGDDQRVDQGRTRQPGHERGVLHRIPEPPAAPAQHVVGPGAAQ